MAFFSELKKCETVDDCRALLVSEINRLSELSIYQDDDEKLQKRIDKLLVDVNQHLNQLGLSDELTIDHVFDDDGETESVLSIFKKWTTWKKVFTWLSPVFIGIGIIIVLLSIFKINIVSGHSMDPTLSDKEYVVSNKYAELNRFDIVIAQEVNDKGEPYGVVKRIIGLPGDTIEYKHDVLYVNGKKTDEPYLADYLKQWQTDRLEKTYGYNADFQKDALYSTAFTTQKTDLATNEANADPAEFKIEVPSNGYILMGDNRIVSKDSREVGAFPKENILGEVVWTGKF